MGFFDFFKPKAPKRIKATGILINSGTGTTQYPSQDYSKQIQEVWKCVVAFRCIDYIAKSCSQVEWDFVDDTNKKIDNPDLNRLLKRPNPMQSHSKYIYNTISYLLCNGNAYPLRIRPLTGARSEIPRELYTLRPDLMKIDTNVDGNISRYKYQDGIKNPNYDIDPKTGHADVLHLKEFHPTDNVYGSARTQVAAYEIDTQNQSTLWNYKILKNEARLGMLYLFKGLLDQETYDMMESKIKEFTGAENAGKSLILQSEQGVDAKPYNWSPKDIDFLQGNRETARKISLAYGVPPELLGIPGDNTYSNLKEARLSFWEETVLYYLNYYTEEFNTWCLSDQKINLRYSVDKIPAFVEKKMDSWEKIDKFTSLTPNEKRALMGFEGVDGGDVLMVNASMLPLGAEPVDLQAQQGKAIQKLRDKGFPETEISELMEAVGW